MATIELKMPKMGESISEATIINWLFQVGDTIDADETILEVATDKVDSEVPSPCTGVIKEILFQANDVVAVGTVMAIIEADGSVNIAEGTSNKGAETSSSKPSTSGKKSETNKFQLKNSPDSDAFLSPLVVSIAQKEGLTIEEVQSIVGTGTEGRIRKSDVMNYVSNRKYALPSRLQAPVTQAPKSTYNAPPIKFVEGHDTVIEMDRMRKMIADHMVYSKHTSPHVTAYIEVDVTNLVNWRNENKIKFQEKYNERLTFTPIFVEAVAKSIEEFPGINASIDGNRIIQYKDINHLANSSRNNCLKPQEIQGSTFTISNVGTFGSLMGTPIINQPEVAILAIGIIKKRGEVITTDKGDELAIRSMMYLSLSFDHRAVDGYLGGSFLRKVGDYLEQFDSQREI